MTDRPILFSGPMVRALLDGRKTQTRRVLKPQPDAGQFFGHMTYVEAQRKVIARNATGMRQDIKIPFAPGDRLWVRDAWCTHKAYDDLSPSEMGGEEAVQYSADGTLQTRGWPAADFDAGRKRASMHMPRWASRLTLLVTEVRVQRLQAISEEDAVAEGIEKSKTLLGVPQFRDYRQNGGAWLFSSRESFRTLWDSLNSERGFGWDANPWVSATSFEVVKANIDEVQG